MEINEVLMSSDLLSNDIDDKLGEVDMEPDYNNDIDENFANQIGF